MATFYKEVRKKSGILMGADGNPIGGKWSFDEDNRNKLPKDISIPKFPKINETTHTKKLKKVITKKKITEITSFEVEDKFFEKKIFGFFKKEKINWNIVQTPMFLNSRDEFKNYLGKSKKTFYGNILQGSS